MNIFDRCASLWSFDIITYFNDWTDRSLSFWCVTAHRCAGGLKKLDLLAGSQRHKHVLGFLNAQFSILESIMKYHCYIYIYIYI